MYAIRSYYGSASTRYPRLVIIGKVVFLPLRRSAPRCINMPAPSSLTTDLKVHWSTVAALLFNVTSAYTRSPEILETRVTGTLGQVAHQPGLAHLPRASKNERPSVAGVV